MNINGVKLNIDVVDILDVYTEALHEKNCLINAKDKLITKLEEELAEERRISDCRLRALKELEKELEKLEEENKSLKKYNKKLKRKLGVRKC